MCSKGKIFKHYFSTLLVNGYEHALLYFLYGRTLFTCYTEVLLTLFHAIVDVGVNK